MTCKTDHLTSRSQRLIEEFNKATSTRHCIARVLTHLADTYGKVEPGSFVFVPQPVVPVSTLRELVTELTAPDTVERAMAGDADAARLFLQELGFIDENGRPRPPYRSEDLDD